MMRSDVVMCVAALFAVLLATSASASSHSEAPGTSANPKADLSDVYAFQSGEPGRDAMTVLVANTQPLQLPYAGPNYYALSAEHFVELHVDADGDGNEDHTFQFLPGARLGGERGDVVQPADPDSLECCRYGVNCDERTVRAHRGIELDVAPGHSVAPALKFVGPVTRDDQSALNFHEHYELWKVDGGMDRRGAGRRRRVSATGTGATRFTKPADYAGVKTFPDYERYAEQYVYDIDIPGCARAGRVFVGQRRDSFAIDLGRIFDLVNLTPLAGAAGAPSQCAAHNRLRRNNVASFVLEVPTECLATGATPTIGVWATVREVLHENAEVLDADGLVITDDHIAGAQVSRLGSPLVNELVIGLRDKNRFSGSHPRDDSLFTEYVQYPTLPVILNALFKAAVDPNNTLATLAPATPRNDLVSAFLTGVDGLNANGFTGEYLRLNTAVAPRPRKAENPMGVLAADRAGFPNGRRLGDDVVDIALRVMMGALCHMNLGCTADDAPVGTAPFTDGAPQHATDFDRRFPFLRTPVPGARGDSSDECRNAATDVLRVDVAGLPELGDGYVYENWLIIAGTPHASGRFTVDASGAPSASEFTVLEQVLKAADEYVLTIEPAADADPAPAASKVLRARFVDGGDAATVSHIDVIGDFDRDAGTLFLRTPTDEDAATNNNGNDENGVWFGAPGAPPTKTSAMPELGNGWTYEAWLIGDAGPISLGTFDRWDERDSSNMFSGVESNAGPPVPGEDLLRNAPAGETFPLDVRGRIVVVSIEPQPDNSPAPFAFKPIVADVPADAALAPAAHALAYVGDASFPSGAVSRFGASTARGSLALSLNGVDDLGDEYVYENWLLRDGVPHAAGRFSVRNGAMTKSEFAVLQETLDAATTFVLSIEPRVDPDPLPAAPKLLAGDFDRGDSSAAAVLDARTIAGAGLLSASADAAGSLFLRTPTDEAVGAGNNGNDENGVWFGLPSAAADATLPTLNDGWRYEGWVIGDAGPLSTGRFSSFAGRDSSNAFSGTQNNAGPPLPGEDFLRNPPAGETFPLDLRGRSVVVSIEPQPDNSPAPFATKPIVFAFADDADTAPTTFSFDYSSAALPSGEATRR